MTVPNKRIRIGVLALQGAFIEHLNVLKKFTQVHAIEVRTQAIKEIGPRHCLFTNSLVLAELSQCDGLILPGGESTAIALAATRNNMIEPIQLFISSGKPVWGVCAGLILLADKIHGGAKKGGQAVFGGLAIQVDRNAFGTQADSFVADLDIAFRSFFHTLSESEAQKAFPGVFIRAPVIDSTGPNVEILTKYKDMIVAVKQGNIIATAFHPELTFDNRFHRYFISILEDQLVSDLSAAMASNTV